MWYIFAVVVLLYGTQGRDKGKGKGKTTSVKGEDTTICIESC
jgi:hypothetical protein